MNGLDPCPRCGHDMDLVYRDRITRKLSCWWCRQARAEAVRKNIGSGLGLGLEVNHALMDAARFDLARQGLERVVVELESEGAWL